MNPILSIIVPVYNAEKYLERCVNSILAQTFEDFELILVDDGSSDRSGVICDRYALQDARVKVIHQNNSGVSAARNSGINSAIGKYVAMVDADDYVNYNTYTRMVSIAEDKQTDLVICGMTEMSSHGDSESKYGLPTDHVLFHEEIVDRIIKSDFCNRSIINSPWNKLYKRSIIIENNLAFPARKRGEDWLFNINYIQLVDSVAYLDEPLYCYCRHDDSAMGQYLPEQYDLWLENRAVRKELISKYDLSIDKKTYNRIWVEKVFYYLLDDHKCHFRSLYRILSDNEFFYACSDSGKSKKTHINIMRQIIAHRLWPLLYPFILIIKKYNSIKCQKY